MRVLIDTDPGMGTLDSDPEDAFAITLALNTPDVDVVGLTTVAGNVSVDHAYANACHLMSVLGRADVPVIAGAAGPQDPARRPLQAQWLREGSRRTRLVPLRAVRPSVEAAASFIVEMSKEQAEPLTIIAIGPLTNIAAAIRLDPAMVGRIDHLWVMGGAYDVSGNHTPFAEFNFWADPDAADEVSRSGVRATYVGLDVCNRTSFPRATMMSVSERSPLGALALNSCGSWFDEMARMDKDGFHLYDSLAVAAALDPAVLVTAATWVVVDAADGPAQGASGAWLPELHGTWMRPAGAPACEIAIDVDLARFRRTFDSRVLAAML